jgi:hypothetical protein
VISFHRLLITTAILFCGGFAAWALGTYLASQRPLMLALSLVFAAFAIGLGYYLANLKRFLGR